MQRRRRTAIVILILLITGLVTPSQIHQTANAQSQNIPEQSASPFMAGRVLVQFRSETSKSRGRRIISQAGAIDGGEIEGTGVHIVELPASADEEAFLSAFKSRDEVEFAELDRRVAPADLIPNDPWYANWQWGLRKVNGPTAWSTTTGSSSIIIAILDSGVDAIHEDLAPQIVPGWNCYANNSDTSDVTGHGTLVAGTAAASSNNSTGVASVAWGCRIMPVRVSDGTGYAYWSTIANGLTWAADHGARVANVSFAASNSATVSAAANYFQSRGGVVAVSAGNDGAFDSSQDNPYVLTVSGTTSSDLRYSWSNYGNNVDVSAPGSVTTTVKGGGYSSAAGTSVAAPIVAGVAALILSANPNLTANQVQDVIKNSADDLGVPGKDTTFGWGRVNAAAAVGVATGAGGSGGDNTPPTVSFTSPSAGATASGTVSVQLAATDNVGVASVNVSVDGVVIGSDSVSPFTLSWNTTTWANGPHTLTATASDVSGNSSTASISVTVNNLSDTTPPTINITSPVAGAVVTGNVSVLVNVVDSSPITKVELYVDGGLVATATTAPFTTRWNSRKASAGTHTLVCKAYDSAGNIGTSPQRSVIK